jgi:predicted lipoprotein with Yx(FWY)xxD motif
MSLRRTATAASAAVAGATIAVLAGVAFATSYTVKLGTADVAGTFESVAVNGHGVTIYRLSGETPHHLLCTSSTCLRFWPPVKVGAHTKLTAAPGVPGRLGRLHRKGFYQLTVGGHPVYTFKLDGGKRGVAGGEGIRSFGGTWHVLAVASAASGGTGTTPMGATAPGTTPTYSYTSPIPYPY